MVNILVAAAALTAASPTVPPAAHPNADPAIFMVHDSDTTVYLFGTFHALDGQAEWFNDQVKDAFERSNELVLETLIPETPGPVGLRQPVRMPNVTASASFLATTRMAISAGKSQGMQVGNGADMVLRHQAELEGKPVEGLETLESQLDMFAKMPDAAAAPAPRPGSPVEPSSIESLSKAMSNMQSAWKRGDQTVFVGMLDQLRAASPDTYRMLFAERNARWADWIAGRMQTPGTVFVAVGAGHLAGRDSLLVRLAEIGITSTRVN
jgi:uncharacterized protein YbaP (TraB family)